MNASFGKGFYRKSQEKNCNLNRRRMVWTFFISVKVYWGLELFVFACSISAAVSMSQGELNYNLNSQF